MRLAIGSFRRALALGLTAVLAASVAETSALAETVTLHHIYTAGDCDPATTETLDVPSGQISLKLHIVNWSPGAYAGIPHWVGFQRYEPESNGYTGWAPYLTHIAGPDMIRPGPSQTQPDSPKAGGVLDYTEADEVLAPFRMQAQIAGPTWHSGDGACHQGAMETWLTITTGGGVTGAVAPNYGGEWTSSQGTMSLSQSGGDVSGTYNGDSGSRVFGQANGASFSGYWTETSTRYKCATQQGGSWYWGRVKWALSADGRHFGGLWGYCDAEPGEAWSRRPRGGLSASAAGGPYRPDR